MLILSQPIWTIFNARLVRHLTTSCLKLYSPYFKFRSLFLFILSKITITHLISRYSLTLLKISEAISCFKLVLNHLSYK